MTQSEHARDAGVIFENTESPPQTESHAKRDEGAPPGEREHGRDAGVTFGNTESPPQTESHAKRDEGAVSSQKEHARDAGVIFRNTESPRRTESYAKRDEELLPGQRERSRDAGVVFENTVSPRQTESHAEGFNGNLSSLLSSVMGFGGAATRFTVDQLQNAAGMMTDPAHALGRLQHSIDNFSRALNEAVEGKPSTSGDRKR